MPANDGDHFVLKATGGLPFEVVTVVSSVARERGLMGVKGLQPGQGMFFIFDKLDNHSMWMMGMLFPLDIVWLDENLQVVSVYANLPPCAGQPCKSYPSKQLAKYGLELAAGEAERLGLRPRAQVTLIGSRPPAPWDGIKF